MPGFPREDASESRDPLHRSVFHDPSRPLAERVADVLGQMTTEEKISQLRHSSCAVERLGIPEYNWWNECLHGVARAGRATVFPQAIGLAATFDEDLIYRVARCISDEARAKYNLATKQNRRRQYHGLTFWTPNINIFRDPRWGRGQETYGEDPYLTGLLGSAFVRGLQGNHPRYLQAAACAKHFAVHSGPERLRHNFDARVSPKDLWETYLPAFRHLVEADVEAVMSAYNRANGEPLTGGSWLRDILRDRWGFQGHVVSDCGAVADLFEGHKVAADATEAAAMALRSGVDLNCGCVYSHLDEALKAGMVDEEEIDGALSRLLRTRLLLGMFDPPEADPFQHLGPDTINCPGHKLLARQAAAKSIVLLKNTGGTLPLDRGLRSLFVLGPGATSAEALLANYHGVASGLVTILEGIVAAADPVCSVAYRQGFTWDAPNRSSHSAAIMEAGDYDAVVVVMGICSILEGEEGDAIASPVDGDRERIELPQHQVDTFTELRARTAAPIIVVLVGGAALAVPEVHELADAVLLAWYPGEQGGAAVADVLFGDVNPSGRLPITFPRSTGDLPPYEDYSMKGRTYRFAEQTPLYPFGFGLGYSTFEYHDLSVSTTADHRLIVQCRVANTGRLPGDEVAQLYISPVNPSVAAPVTSLRGVRRVTLAPGQGKTVSFPVSSDDVVLIDDQGHPATHRGRIRVTIGGSSPGERSRQLGAPVPVGGIFDVPWSKMR